MVEKVTTPRVNTTTVQTRAAAELRRRRAATFTATMIAVWARMTAAATNTLAPTNVQTRSGVPPSRFRMPTSRCRARAALRFWKAALDTTMPIPPAMRKLA